MANFSLHNLSGIIQGRFESIIRKNYLIIKKALCGKINYVGVWGTGVALPAGMPVCCVFRPAFG